MYTHRISYLIYIYILSLFVCMYNCSRKTQTENSAKLALASLASANVALANLGLANVSLADSAAANSALANLA